MTLTASKNILEKHLPQSYRNDYPATDSIQYFRGGLVALVGGKLVKPTTATVGASAVFICEDEILTGVSTTEQIGVRSGMFKLLNGDSIVAADVGKLGYIGANGDDSVYKAGAAATDVVVGVIDRVDAATDPGGAGVWVHVLGLHEIIKPLTATTSDNLSGA